MSVGLFSLYEIVSVLRCRLTSPEGRRMLQYLVCPWRSNDFLCLLDTVYSSFFSVVSLLVLCYFDREWSFLHAEPLPRWLFNRKSLRGLLKINYGLLKVFYDPVQLMFCTPLNSRQIMTFLYENVYQATLQDGQKFIHPYDRTSETLFSVSIC